MTIKIYLESGKTIMIDKFKTETLKLNDIFRLNEYYPEYVNDLPNQLQDLILEFSKPGIISLYSIATARA